MAQKHAPHEEPSHDEGGGHRPRYPDPSQQRHPTEQPGLDTGVAVPLVALPAVGDCHVEVCPAQVEVSLRANCARIEGQLLRG
jgi:hypothetical protein